MSNLFNIIEELDRVFWDIEENEGELTPDLEGRLSVSEEEFSDKLDAYALYIKQLQGQEKVLKDEIATIQARIEANNNKAARLKTALVLALQKFGEKKDNGEYRYKTAAKSFWTQISKSVIVDDEFNTQDYISHNIKFNIEDNDDYYAMLDVLNDNQIDFETNPKIDKKALKKDLEEGLNIEGAELVKTRGIRFR